MLRAAAAAALIAGCFHPASIECADGTLCPAGTTCDVAEHRCISADQTAACDGLAEGDACTLAGAPGTCHDGGCAPAVCGDGIRNGTEPCEGSDLGGLTCNDFGYSNPDGLACTADCTYDRSRCTGRCGNGIVETGEVCDGAPPPGACTDFGFDGGDLACGAGCGTSFATCARFGWLPESTPVALPFGIGGVSANDLWLVGDQGAVGHYDGTQWSAVPSGTTAILFSVWAVAADDVWIGGSDGTLLHWNGSTLSPVAAPADNFVAIWASDSTHVFLAGLADVYARNGTSWDLVGDLRTAITAGGAHQVLALRGSGPADLWAASTSDGCGVWHWDGVTWTGIALDADPGCQLSDLAVDAAGGVWAVGTHTLGTDPTDGVLVHLDGSTTSELELGMDSPAGIAFVAPDEIWIGGTGQLAYWDGNLPLTSALPGLQAASIAKMFAAGAGDLAAVAANGTLYRFTGRAYAEPTSPVAGSVFWTSPDGQPFIVDPTGGTEMWTLAPDATWQTTHVAGASLLAMSGTAADDVWAAGRDGVYHFTGTWTHSLAVNAGDPTLWIRAVHAASASDVWAASGKGSIEHYASGTWAPRDLPSTALNVDGFAGGGNDVWAIAEDNAHVDQYGLLRQLWHWNGTAWTQLPAPDPDLRAIYSPAAGQLVAVAADARVLAWDGAQWHDVALDSVRPLVAIDGTAPDDLYAASDSALFHFDGHAWSPMTLPSDVRMLGDQALLAIRARAEHLDLLAKGANGYHTLLRTRPF